jgi:hypothetical protein
MNAGRLSRALATSAWLLGAGCGGPRNVAEPTNAPQAPPCAGAAPSYRNDVAPLLQHYCLGCHTADGDAGEDHDFSRYPVLHAQRQLLQQELEALAMPPRDQPQPTAQERRLLARWACWGAPDN